jgi:hypothetical protein
LRIWAEGKILDLDQALSGFILSSCWPHHDRQTHHDHQRRERK